MRDLVAIILLLARSERSAFLRGFVLAATVLAMGVSLLALSGWFITAAAAAGLAGIGIIFNVFAPSAMVRFLALGRTAARYGERLLTHDATLRALSNLRIRLLEGFLAAPWRQLERLRANSVLNRVTADVDALDGALLRLALPGLAGAAVIVATAAALWMLVHPGVALVVSLGYLVVPTLIFIIGQHVARRPSRQAEAAMQAARSRLIDLVVAREDLTVYGQLQTASDHVRDAQARFGAARAVLDRIERRTGAALDLTGTAVTALALGLGGMLAGAGTISAAEAAIGVFAALAMAEAVAPIRRALAEIGRMVRAARRIAPSLQTAGASPTQVGDCPPQAPELRLAAVRYRFDTRRRDLFAPLSFTVGPGETVALTGASGSGKSTVLLMATGLLRPTSGAVTLGGQRPADWPPDSLWRTIAMVPQGYALIAGSVAENLRLAAPEAGESALWDALRATALAETVEAKGGLDARLGFRGAGLSGGEARRLVLARALLRRPGLLLLDEPTEGLDVATAAEVMAGLRAALPDAAILMAAHRAVEVGTADRVIPLYPADS